MFVRRLIYRLIHDALYDWYEEVKKGKESVFIFVIHWGLWVGGFIFIHCFWGLVIYKLFVTKLEFWQFMLGIVIIIFAYLVLWFFVDRFYDGDRPTIENVNNKWI